MQILILFVMSLMLLGSSVTAQTTQDSTGRYLSMVIGPAPAQQLANLSGPAFDQAYIRLMYQQNSDIANLASMGESRSADLNMRRFSRGINRERVDMNRKLAPLYSPGPAGGSLSLSSTRITELTGWLGNFYSPPIDEFYEAYIYSPFDIRYVTTMVALLQQSTDASKMAVTRTTSPAIRDQAARMIKSNDKEIDQLQRWQKRGFLTIVDESIYCENLSHETDIRCPTGPFGRGPLIPF